MLLFAVGAALTGFGLYVLGSAVSAGATPYGFALLVGGVLVVLGAAVLLLARATRSRAGASSVLPAAASAVACALALAAGLAGLPTDDTLSGPECLTGGGTLLDCDDPRIDTDAERGTARPRGSPPPDPGPAATPAG